MAKPARHQHKFTIYLFLKRVLDFSLALVCCILFFPVLVGLSICVWIDVGWPILFVQSRPGLRSKIFKLYKYRTMRHEERTDGTILPDALRLTKFGRFLRSTSLDELPELVNVLFGNMSLVGPRPLLPEYLELYTQRQARRHEMRPGITGWAQVNGRNSVSWSERFELDVWYVENASLSLDMKILFRTIHIVIGRSGVNAPGEATMARFTGSN